MNGKHGNEKDCSFDELLEAIEASVWNPNETAWCIYNYLKKNYATDSSKIVRTLLSAYIKLELDRPSLIHSCILGIAVKVSDTYADFNFPKFLEYWGFPKFLRREDLERQKGKDGRTFLSLKERAERRRDSWLLHHGGNRQSSNIRTMFAVKVFEKEKNGRNLRFVKLVAGDGWETIAESHLFPCKPWEIQGTMFEILTRTSENGNERVVEVAATKKTPEEIFPPVVGYVDGIDVGHGHVHIFDAISRHFVAECPKVKLSEGCYVLFSPIVPAIDKFKTAYVIKAFSLSEGREKFGWLEAEVLYADRENRYFRYRIVSPINETPEGKIEKEGIAPLVCINDNRLEQSLHTGQHIFITLFLKRGIDKTKRNHVAEAFLLE